MKIKVLCFLVVWGLGVGGLGAQVGVVDSLEGILPKLEEQDSSRCSVLNELAFLFLRINPDSSILYAKEAIRTSESIHHLNGMTEASNTMAKAFIAKNELDSALLCLDLALSQIDENIHSDIAATLLLTKGISFFRSSRLPDAAASFERSASLYAKGGDSSGEESALLNMSVVLISMEEFTKSRVVLKRVTNSSQPENRYNAFINLGNVVGFEGDIEQSLAYFKEAERVAEAYDFDMLNLKLNLAITYEKLEDYEQAIRLYREVKELCSERGEKRILGKTAYNLGYLYAEQGDYHRALASIEEAEGFLAPDNGQEWLELYNIKHSVLKGLGNFKEAYEALNKTYKLRDSLFNAERTAAIAEIETKYQTEKKELQNQALQLENELQAKTNRNQRLGLGGLGLGLLFLSGLAFFLYRQRQRIQAQKAEIELLNREQRHRMMNNLVFANSLMGLQVKRLEEQPEARQAVKEAEARLHAMSALHRRLHHEGEGQKSIGIHGYLEEITAALQRSFSTAEQPLAIKLHSPEEAQVDGEAAMRIGLIVNELATNSCKHAFAEQPDPQIDVHLMPEGEGRYRLIYTDNGSGLPADFEIDTQKSMGLYLIHNLVKQLNGRIAFSGESGTRVECELNLEAV